MLSVNYEKYKAAGAASGDAICWDQSSLDM